MKPLPTLDPIDQPNVDHLFTCKSCDEILSRYEQIDPIVIEGDVYCDICGSNLVNLRLEGFLPSVKSRTEKVVEDHNRKLDADLAEMIAPIRTVNHI